VSLGYAPSLSLLQLNLYAQENKKRMLEIKNMMWGANFQSSFLDIVSVCPSVSFVSANQAREF
jgi:hypothetical protein